MPEDDVASRRPDFRGIEVESPTLPLPPPRDQDSLEDYLRSVASMPAANRDLIMGEVGRLREEQDSIHLLNEALLAFPCLDTGRHLLLLSVVGEVRDQSSLEALERLIWLRDEDIFGAGPPSARLGPCDFDPGGMLQARAAEMFVWTAGAEHEDAVVRILREHPATGVRVATIDAWLYRQEDSPAAIQRMNEWIRSDDAWAVELPRRTAEADPEEFNAKVLAHAERFGEGVELPERMERTNDRPPGGSDVR